MALYKTGPTEMVDGHQAYRPDILFFLGLRVCPTEQWSSVGALSNQLPRSSPIIGMRRCMEPAS